MKTATAFTLPTFLTSLLAGCSATAPAPPVANAVTSADEWIHLFNGKDLTGWKPKIRGYAFGENFGNTFRVENGVLKVSYDQYAGKFDRRFGHLFYEKPFSHYVLHVEYRFVGEQIADGEGWALRNSGAMLHCQAPESMSRDQEFPVSIEGQFLGGDGKKPRPTSNVCTPGTNIVLAGKLHTEHCTESTSPTFVSDQWVSADFEVHGAGVIKHIVDGQTVLTYDQPQLDPTDADAKKLIHGDNLLIEGGYISLQSESHPIEFRKVQVKVLPGDPSKK